MKILLIFILSHTAFSLAVPVKFTLLWKCCKKKKNMPDTPVPQPNPVSSMISTISGEPTPLSIKVQESNSDV
ncbi:MAG: hypothetical protein AMXMBFR12_05970 [Candidatus Babeliales bacterium]